VELTLQLSNYVYRICGLLFSVVKTALRVFVRCQRRLVVPLALTKLFDVVISELGLSIQQSGKFIGPLRIAFDCSDGVDGWLPVLCAVR
jgi:hypothetical protein